MKLVTFRYQQFASAIQEPKPNETQSKAQYPFMALNNESTTDTPDAEKESHIKRIQLIGNRPEVILGSWQ